MGKESDPTQWRLPHLDIWQRALAEEMDEASARRLLMLVQARYDELYSTRTRFSHSALRMHLEDNILPGLALYQVLRGEGQSEEAALKSVERLFEAAMEPRRRQTAMIGRLPIFYHLTRGSTRWIMDRNFPAEGWDTEWVEVSSKVVAFDIRRCFYLDTLTAYDAPELTPVFCNLDDFMYGRGDDCCDFRFYRATRQ